MKIFRSIRFNIFLGLLIALGSALGTFLPQISDAPEKVGAFQAAHPQWGRLFGSLGFFDLYHSWWFMGLLALMAFDIVLCKLWSKPPDIGLVSLPPEDSREEELEKRLAQKDEALKLKPHQAIFTAGFAMPDALAKAQSFLSRGGYHLRPEFSGAGGGAFLATRHRFQRWGSYLSHIALVLILIGALVKGLFGFDEMVPVMEGQSRPLQNRPGWDVFVDKFTVKYYEGTEAPKFFSSILRVKKGDKLLGAKTIVVNDPLDISGVRFYQASWGAGGMFRSVTLNVGGRELALPQKTVKKIPGMALSVQADVMLPDFTVVNGQPDSASYDLKNPAVRFLFFKGSDKSSPVWLFQNDPKLCVREDPDGTLSQTEMPPFYLSSLDPVLFSGIQVAYDPGFKVVIAGSIVWLLGMTSLFYLHRRRLWVVVEPGGSQGTSRVCIGGWSSRPTRDFEKEFDLVIARLRAELLSSGDFQLEHHSFMEVS